MIIAATDREHLVRDMGSMGLINKDTALYKQRQVAKQKEARIKKLEDDFESLTRELQVIRELFASIVQKE
jgi:uncharacterized protein involved in exopolysaccharide biosynthesis